MRHRLLAEQAPDFMDQSATFARHFARLLSLLLRDAGNVVEQKMSLRALVTVSKRGVVTIISRAGRVFADTESVADALTGIHDLADRMAEHSVIGIRVATGARAADLLGLAKVLAARGRLGDGGAYVREQFGKLDPKGIDLATIPPTGAATQSAPGERGEASAAAASATTAVSPDAPTVVSSTAPTVIKAARDVGTPAAQQPSGLLAQLAAPDVSQLSHETLLAALDSAMPVTAARTLDELILVAEHAQRGGKTVIVGEIMHGIVMREARVLDPELRRAYGQAIKRLAKPSLLRAVASLIPKRPERRQFYYEVLERTAEDGADAVIEQLSQATTTEDRKAFFEVLRELKDAVPALKRMLGDSRWFVVRNAADLLGEMSATQGEEALVGLLQHGDERVRRAATNALLRLGTPDAMKGIYEAVNDKSPEVRIQATAAIATRRDGRTSQTLIRAIEDEPDGDVQLAMIAALGRIATAEAVQKLVRMAEPENRLFRKKTTNVRVAAIQALGDAKTPAAIVALRGLLEDKDREVRDTAKRVLAHSGR